MRIYLNRQGIYTRQTVLFSRYRCSRPARCCVFIRGKHPVCGEPLFCLSANPDSLSELCGFHIDHRSRSFLLQVSGVSSRLSFCCTSLVSGFIIHDKGRVVYSQSVQQMRRIFAPKIQKTGIHQLHQNVALNTGGVTNAAFPMALCWQMFYCGPLSRAIFRLLFRRGEKQ